MPPHLFVSSYFTTFGFFHPLATYCEFRRATGMTVTDQLVGRAGVLGKLAVVPEQVLAYWYVGHGLRDPKTGVTPAGRQGHS